jgi:hypothetical protein
LRTSVKTLRSHCVSIAGAARTDAAFTVGFTVAGFWATAGFGAGAAMAFGVALGRGSFTAMGLGAGTMMKSSKAPCSDWVALTSPMPEIDLPFSRT